MIWLEGEYIENADESVQTVIVGDDRVIYVHFLDGYYSVIEGVYSLYKFLNGNITYRDKCYESEDDVLQYLKSLEK